MLLLATADAATRPTFAAYYTNAAEPASSQPARAAISAAAEAACSASEPAAAELASSQPAAA